MQIHRKCDKSGINFLNYRSAQSSLTVDVFWWTLLVDLCIQFTHIQTLWLPWIWQIFFVTRSNSCTTLRSEWRPKELYNESSSGLLRVSVMKTRIAWTSVDSFRDATSIRFIFHSIKLQRQSRKCPGGKQCSSFSLKNYNSPQLKNYDYVVTYWASTCKYLRSLQAYWPTKKAFFTASQKTQSYSRLIVNNPTSRTGRPHVTENITIGKSHQFLIAVTQKLY